jgi:hypothetical protein
MSAAVGAAPKRVMVQRQVPGKPCPPGHEWRLVIHRVSDPGGSGSAGRSRSGRVADLAEPGLQPFGAGVLLVVGDADA